MIYVWVFIDIPLHLVRRYRLGLYLFIERDPHDSNNGDCETIRIVSSIAQMLPQNLQPGGGKQTGARVEAPGSRQQTDQDLVDDPGHHQLSDGAFPIPSSPAQAHKKAYGVIYNKV